MNPGGASDDWLCALVLTPNHLSKTKPEVPEDPLCAISISPLIRRLRRNEDEGTIALAVKAPETVNTLAVKVPGTDSTLEIVVLPLTEKFPETVGLPVICETVKLDNVYLLNSRVGLGILFLTFCILSFHPSMP